MITKEGKTLIEEIREDAKTARSTWDQGVYKYAEELAESLDGYSGEVTREKIRATMLNGAKDWEQYSGSGSTLVYSWDIVNRLAPPSIVKKTKGGRYNPNSRENWIDVQARALRQAAIIILRIMGV